MPTPQKAKTARKTQKAKKTVRQGVAEKLSHIERALADIRQMVDMNCGEAVLRTARAAGAAAAEEVLTTLSPAIAATPVAAPNAAALFNTPPAFPTAPFGAVKTAVTAAPAAPLPTVRKSRKTKKMNEDNLEALVAAEEARMARADAIRKGLVAPQEGNIVSPLTQALLEQEKEFAAEAAPAKKPGPKLWNEFLRNYMARQEAAGRKITRLQAMAEAGPNYRAKYGIAEKKTHKTAKVAKTQGAVQVAPVEVAANTLLNRGAVPMAPKKAVKIQAPGNTVPLTPGRPSPPVPLTAPAATGILDTLRNALTGSPASTGSSSSSNNSSSTSSRNSSNSNNSLSTSSSGSSTSSSSSNSSSTSSGSNSSSNAGNSPVVSPPATAAAAANNSNDVTRPNPTEYGYENEGEQENGTRKIRVGGEEYLMTNQNRGLFRPVNGSLEWVGYLEPGGVIRATNAPE